MKGMAPIFLVGCLCLILGGCQTVMGDEEIKIGGNSFEEYDLDKDDYITDLEVDLANKTVFKTIDMDKDKVISPKEHSQMLLIGSINYAEEENLGSDYVEENIERITKSIEGRFEKMDTNGDQKITLEEYQEGNDHVRVFIQNSDLNGDGKLHKKEAELYLRADAIKEADEKKNRVADVEEKDEMSSFKIKR